MRSAMHQSLAATCSREIPPPRGAGASRSASMHSPHLGCSLFAFAGEALHVPKANFAPRRRREAAAACQPQAIGTEDDGFRPLFVIEKRSARGARGEVEYRYFAEAFIDAPTHRQQRSIGRNRQ